MTHFVNLGTASCAIRDFWSAAIRAASRGLLLSSSNELKEKCVGPQPRRSTCLLVREGRSIDHVGRVWSAAQSGQRRGVEATGERTPVGAGVGIYVVILEDGKTSEPALGYRDAAGGFVHWPMPAAYPDEPVIDAELLCPVFGSTRDPTGLRLLTAGRIESAAVTGAAHSLRFEAFGCAGEVASDDSDLLERVPAILPPGWRSSTQGSGVRFTISLEGGITRNGAPIVAVPTEAEDLLDELEVEIRHHVALHARDHLFIHAGVVGIDGVAVVIPGASHSGKTTLVAELVRAGASYYSDEYAVVDPTGSVHPYAKPLSVRGSGATGGPAASVPVPAKLTGEDPIRAGLIVVTEYRSGAQWLGRKCSRGQGALALVQHTVAARTRPADTFQAAIALTQQAQTIAGPRGEASRVVGSLVALAQSVSTGSKSRSRSRTSCPIGVSPPGSRPRK
jgi:hypothetical protein